MFTLRLDNAIMTHVQEFVANKPAARGRTESVMFVTVQLTMSVDANGQPDVRQGAAHFMFRSDGSILVGSQTSEKAVIPDHHNWEIKSQSGSADCLQAIARVLMEVDLKLRDRLCVNYVHPVHTEAEIYRIQYRDIQAAYIPGSRRFVELEFPKAA